MGSGIGGLSKRRTDAWRGGTRVRWRGTGYATQVGTSSAETRGARRVDIFIQLAVDE